MTPESEADSHKELKTPGISACIISFNEERNIASCIESVSWCDEVVVVDSFSKDRTGEIARERGARVIQMEWPGQVVQKNRAAEAARCSWILSVDCDEVVTPALRDAIRERVESKPRAAGYFISRKTHYLGRWLNHGGWFPEWRLRLFRKDSGQWKGLDPHGGVHLKGRSERIHPGEGDSESAVILHRPFRDLSHQIQVLDQYTGIQARELFQAGRRTGPGNLLLRPLWRFFWRYLFRAGFLDGLPGLHMAMNHAYAGYMKYARLWELQRSLAEPPERSPQ